MFQSKKRDVEVLKNHLLAQRRKKWDDNENDMQAKRHQNVSVKMQIENSNKVYRDFLASKKHRLQDDFRQKIEDEKKVIYALEAEAQDLEKTEEQYIAELQEIQQEEKDAYREMEEALVTSSQSKRERTAAQSNIMMTTASGIFSDNLPKISNARTKASISSRPGGDAFNNTGFNSINKKSKSQGRNTANYNTTANFMVRKQKQQADCLSNDQAGARQ